MIKFEKVSFDQFKKDFLKCGYNPDFTDEMIKEIYDSIQLPKRATKGSAGYDFFSPFTFKMYARDGLAYAMSPLINKDIYLVTIPTGIRWICDENLVLMLHPRSSLGFKYGIHLRNTTGVIDKDYSHSDNEGHIMAKLTTEDMVEVEAGKAFMQGIIMPYYTTDDDDTDSERNGGFGSTDKK